MESETATLTAGNFEGQGNPFKVFLNQAVREYRDKVIEHVLRKPIRKPWMKYREIRIMEELLDNLRPKRALEWGAGCDLFPEQARFSDYRAYSGGIWIGSVYRPIDSLIDLNKHRSIWGYYNALGKRFRL